MSLRAPRTSVVLKVGGGDLTHGNGSRAGDAHSELVWAGQGR